MTKLSVIAAVYDAENYLRKFVASILNQTFSDLELILVDDGSHDSSAKICDECAEADPRVRVTHQTNQGLISARNAGLELATGAWITFPDSDDYLETDAYEAVMARIQKTGSDVGAFGLVQEDEHGNIIRKFVCRDGVANRYDAVAKLFDQPPSITNSVGNKVFSAAAISGLRFLPESKLAEDRSFVYRCFLQSNQLAIMQDIFYHQYVHAGSATRGGATPTDYLSSNAVHGQITADIRVHFPSLYARAYAYFITASLLPKYDAIESRLQIAKPDERKAWRAALAVIRARLLTESRTALASGQIPTMAKAGYVLRIVHVRTKIRRLIRMLRPK